MSKVRKRDGSIVEFDKSKIEKAILKSMKNGSGIVRPQIAANIADEIAELYIESETPVEISAIEQLVFNKLIAKKQKLTARAYESYRSIREFQREHNTIDMDVIGIVNGANTDVLTNNSNKNENLISTSRDLVAEEVSKDYSRRKLLPPHIVQAHDEGLIYIHDLGHYMNPSINCLEEHTWIDIKKDGKISRVQMKDLIDILHLNSDGTSTIDDIVYVRDNKGWTRLIAVKRRKSPEDEKLYKFLTATGIPLICTGRHRIPVLRGNEIVLSEASDITAYDSLLKTNNYNATFNYEENLSVVDLTNIPTDKLISIETNYTDCCVMDLQTESNYYIANDYLVHNCQLVDLKDMLDNGTCINKKLIESPHRFLTACTIATQIAAQVASEQFGGQTMSVSHLAPYLRKSRKKIEEKLRAELDGLVSDEVINKLIDERLHEELSSGVQTFNYQLNTLQTSNGFLNSGRC